MQTSIVHQGKCKKWFSVPRLPLTVLLWVLKYEEHVIYAEEYQYANFWSFQV